MPSGFTNASTVTRLSGCRARTAGPAARGRSPSADVKMTPRRIRRWRDRITHSLEAKKIDDASIQRGRPGAAQGLETNGDLHRRAGAVSSLGGTFLVSGSGLLLGRQGAAKPAGKATNKRRCSPST